MTIGFFKTKLHNISASIIAAICLLGSATAAADLTIAKTPLFLGKTADPNIMFILDDSGSMLWSYLPDSIAHPITRQGDCIRYNARGRCAEYEAIHERRIQSHLYNAQYYNPEAIYSPPPKGDGTYFPSVSFTNAPTDGFDHSVTDQKGRSRVDLSKDFQATWNHKQYSTSQFGPYFVGSQGRAHYYELRETSHCKNKANWSDNSCWEKTEIRGQQQEQNFANWYSYYRTRELAARSGIGIAFNQLDEDLRVGFGAINKGAATVDGKSHRTIIRGVRKFSGSDRQAFFDSLYSRNASGGTPLRQALDDAGQYFMRTDDAGPWGNDPAKGSSRTSSSDQLACRQSATVLMTDGYWNGNAAGTAAARRNVDNEDGPLITGPGGRTYQYTPKPPYSDRYSNTLADVAMYYWNRDLRSDLENAVPTSPANPAFWQHMRTYTVALGLDGTKDSNTPLDEITHNFWPQPEADKETALDDLWHAAVNGRGGFFSAADPDTFATELNSMLKRLAEETRRAAAAVTANSTQIEEGSLLYQASMQSGTWTGELRAHRIDPETKALSAQPLWEAGSKLDPHKHAERKIYSATGYGANKGVEFRAGSLSGAKQQQGSASERLHNNHALVNYLRGDKSNEGMSEGKFRPRSTLLGDIVHSTPEHAGGRNFMFHLLPGNEGSSYPAWLASRKAQDGTIFVGSNNGMLHAFNAKTGVEQFAYVPYDVSDKLHKLADPGYQHDYYVDGSPKAIDAYLDGSWKTVLVGSTGLGGRSVFALDVSRPSSFSTSNVLWEFSHPDLGYGVKHPTIVRLTNGQWYAIFGNGYNSGSSTPKLFLVNLKSGEGTVIAAAAGTGRGPNGLADPTPVDLNGDRITDVVYAGDLHGNLHKFDLTQVKNNLKANDVSTKIIFTATDAAGNRQPITSRPEISGHPEPGAVMVFFGTGQYFLTGDDVVGNSPQVQTFYGIVDRGGSAVSRSQLLQQSIISEQQETYGARSYWTRQISKNSDLSKSTYGWYLDLIVQGRPATGERVVSAPSVQGGRVRFLTFTPSDDPCAGGGSNWLMEIDALSGAHFHKPIWDLSGDGMFDSSGGGARLGDGPPGGLSRSLATGEGPNQLYPGTDDAQIGVDDGSSGAGAGRQSWREL